jgi:formate dehydrogenase major subunit
MVIELLQSDMPEKEYTRHNEVDEWAKKLKGGQAALRAAPRGRARSLARRDRGQSRRLHPVQSLRARLPRSAGQRRHRHGRPRPDAKIVFDFDDPMGESTCVACGECVQACPTGALMPASMLDALTEARQVRSIRCARTAASAASSPITSRTTRSLRRGPRRSGQSQPPVRQGPLRLRLHPASAAPHQAR